MEGRGGEGRGQPKKNSCIGLPKYFTEIFAMRARKQIGINTSLVKKVPSFLASVHAERMFIQNDILTGKLFIYLILYTTVNQHSSERIKQDYVPININALITHPSLERFTTPAGSTSPTLFEEQCSLNDLQSWAVVVFFFHKLSISPQREPSRKHPPTSSQWLNWLSTRLRSGKPGFDYRADQHSGS